ncbi:MAG: hypothetical protein HY832_00425, partial [Candidatus Aenigmarchaeota archaeon]|nr:hypothetical protein [Candidatus Aenigmarchaeota archaeon]
MKQPQNNIAGRRETGVETTNELYNHLFRSKFYGKRNRILVVAAEEEIGHIDVTEYIPSGFENPEIEQVT